MTVSTPATSSIRTQLEPIAAEINDHFERVEAARDQGLSLHRKVIKHCSLGIRAIHRQEFTEAEGLLQQARQLLDQAQSALQEFPFIYYAGFLQDAQKEYAEGRLTQALIARTALPAPCDIGVDHAPYLNGMAEAVGEMRRYILDRIRAGDLSESERLLDDMDNIYYILISMDFPDAITRGLRRSTDVARGCLERTRGDLTNHFDRQKIDRALRYVEEQMVRGAGQATAS
jgi:translin